MKIHTHQYQCPLGRLQPEVTDLDAVKQRGWLEQHILVVSEADTRLREAERQLIRAIGQRLYGRRRHD